LKKHIIMAIGLILPLSGGGAFATEGMSNAEVAKELANPNTSLGSLNFNFDYTRYKGDLPGADAQEGYRLSFQPILPYKLGEGTNLFVRPLVPLIYRQPIPELGGFDDSSVALGDISFDAAIAKTLPSKTVILGGIVGTMDTATDDAVGGGQWRLGPEAAIAQIFDWGVLGVLASHQWDVAGDNYDTSVSAGQYFYTVNLKDGWQITSQPTFSYNHKAPNGDEKWTLPIGAGIAKTTRFGKTPWKFRLEYWHYVKQSDVLGPDYQVRFTVGPVVPLPW